MQDGRGFRGSKEIRAEQVLHCRRHSHHPGPVHGSDRAALRRLDLLSRDRSSARPRPISAGRSRSPARRASACCRRRSSASPTSASATPTSPDVEMEQFRAEVELAPLLKGEVRIIQMTVERPHFHIDIASFDGECRRRRRLAARPASGFRWSACRSSTAARSSPTAAPAAAGAPTGSTRWSRPRRLMGPAG